MPFKVYTTADGTKIHKYEKAPPATAATRKPVLTNTKMSLAEGMFDKTKAVNIKEALKAKKAKKEPTDGYVVSHEIVDELTDMIHRELTSGAWHMTEIPEEERQDYVDENFNELVTELGGGYGVFDEVIEELEERLGYSPKTMMLGMKYLRDDAGYTMFDDYIEKHSG
jgi:restriction endonuclease Mrr